jgi:hypothetical protein
MLPNQSYLNKHVILLLLMPLVCSPCEGTCSLLKESHFHCRRP